MEKGQRREKMGQEGRRKKERMDGDVMEAALCFGCFSGPGLAGSSQRAQTVLIMSSHV